MFGAWRNAGRNARPGHMSRISLKTALLSVAVIAAWISTAHSNKYFGMALRWHMSIVLCSLPIFGAVYSRGATRAFCFGAIFALLTTLIPAGWPFWVGDPKVTYIGKI